MKSIFTFLLALATVTTFAQKSFQGTAKYMSKTTMDMSRFGKMSEQQKKERMARMKSFLEKTYTLTFNKTASSFREDVSLEAPGASGPTPKYVPKVRPRESVPTTRAESVPLVRPFGPFL